MSWNFDMSQAPRGHTVSRTVRRKGKEAVADVFVKDIIIVADQDSDKTGKSYWIPDEGRWCGFIKDRPPLAWQHWPEHPKKGGDA